MWGAWYFLPVLLVCCIKAALALFWQRAAVWLHPGNPPASARLSLPFPQSQRGGAPFAPGPLFQMHLEMRQCRCPRLVRRCRIKTRAIVGKETMVGIGIERNR